MTPTMKPKLVHFAVFTLLFLQLVLTASMFHVDSMNNESSVSSISISVQNDNRFASPSSSDIENGFISKSLNWGDAYANAFLPERSAWFYFGENAIGAPDGIYAQIFSDYGNGYLTLDMGEQEEIVNGPGDDFTVIADGGNYSVFLQPSLESLPSLIGHANGTHSFDLSDLSMDLVRYVRVEYFVGDTVELDAIEAINYNAPTSDIYDPQISGPDDFWVWSNQSLIQLEWEAFDDTPNNYTVLVNGSVVQDGPWDGSDILVSITNPGAGFWNVTLLLYDLSGNSASDSVFLQVMPAMEPDIWSLFVPIVFGVGVIVVFALYIFMKVRRD